MGWGVYEWIGDFISGYMVDYINFLGWDKENWILDFELS